MNDLATIWCHHAGLFFRFLSSEYEYNELEIAVLNDSSSVETRTVGYMYISFL